MQGKYFYAKLANLSINIAHHEFSDLSSDKKYLFLEKLRYKILNLDKDRK